MNLREKTHEGRSPRGDPPSPSGYGVASGTDLGTNPPLPAVAAGAKAGPHVGGYAPSGHALHPDVRIGHVHLTVANLERAVGFYRDVLGFEVTQRYGDNAVFLSAGGYHHHIGLNTWAGEGAPAPPPGRTGLYHFAILYPSRCELARAFKRLFDHGVPIDGASDHGVSEAIYLRDPDGNGLELYWDRPPADWPRVGERLKMTTRPLNLDGLLGELPDLRSPSLSPSPETEKRL